MGLSPLSLVSLFGVEHVLHAKGKCRAEAQGFQVTLAVGQLSKGVDAKKPACIAFFGC